MNLIAKENWIRYSKHSTGRENRAGIGIASVFEVGERIIAEVWLIQSECPISVHGPFMSYKDAERATDGVLESIGWKL